MKLGFGRSQAYEESTRLSHELASPESARSCLLTCVSSATELRCSGRPDPRKQSSATGRQQHSGDWQCLCFRRTQSRWNRSTPNATARERLCGRCDRFDRRERSSLCLERLTKRHDVPYADRHSFCRHAVFQAIAWAGLVCRAQRAVGLPVARTPARAASLLRQTPGARLSARAVSTGWRWRVRSGAHDGGLVKCRSR